MTTPAKVPSALRRLGVGKGLRAQVEEELNSELRGCTPEAVGLELRLIIGLDLRPVEGLSWSWLCLGLGPGWGVGAWAKAGVKLGLRIRGLDAVRDTVRRMLPHVSGSRSPGNTKFYGPGGAFGTPPPFWLMSQAASIFWFSFEAFLHLFFFFFCNTGPNWASRWGRGGLPVQISPPPPPLLPPATT